MERFRVRLNCVDFYQATPTSLDPPLWGHQTKASQQNAPQVPIIRVFGATETGQKVCAHIHGAFPYLYLEYDGSLVQDQVDAYIQSLRLSIDHALAVSYRRNNYDGKAVYVAHISLVKGVPFFGYHVGFKYFLKVYILNPLHMTRLADLLYQGAIMKRVFQPYESHLQYLLQWMCDFNLYGCAYIDTDKPHFRSPIPDYMDLNSDAYAWHDRSIPTEFILDQDEFPRQSHCSLEVDICVQDITNRAEIVSRPLHHDFVERFTHLAPNEKLVQSMAGLWRDETIRRKRRMGISDPGSSPFPAEVMVSMSADSRNTRKGGWIHEEEFRQMVGQISEDERARDSARQVSFDSFVTPRTEHFPVQTTLASVEELFTDRVRSGLESGKGFVQAQPPSGTQAVVDESMVLKHAQDDDDYDSNHEHLKQSTQKTVLRPEKGDAMGDTEVHARPVQTTPLLNSGTPRRKRFLIKEEEAQKRRKLESTATRPSKTPTKRNGAQASSTTTMSYEALTGSQVLQRLDKQQAAQEHVKASKPQRSSQDPLRLSQSYGYPIVKNPHTPSTPDLKERSLESARQTQPQTPTTSNHSRKAMTSSQSAAESAVRSINTPSSLATPPSSALKAAAKYHMIAGHNVLAYLLDSMPPSCADVKSTTELEAGVNVVYQDAYYGDERDVPERSREYAGQDFKLESNTVPFLADFDPTGTSAASRGDKAPVVLDKASEELLHQKRRWGCSLRSWEIATAPPSCQEVTAWKDESDAARDLDLSELKQQPMRKVKRQNRPDPELSQIAGPTQKDKHGFKYSQSKHSTSVRHETQYMSTMSLEVHVNSRRDLGPDPEQDEISAIFWCLQSDDDAHTDRDDGLRFGILLLDADGEFAAKVRKQSGIQVDHEPDELDLLNHMVDIVREFDPDILAGYEVHNGSWGYLIERARLKYEYNLPDELSRMKSQSHGRFGKDADRWGFTHTSTIRVTGRHMINVWRAMRGELNLLQYTMENVVFHLLHRRVPHYSFANLTRWFKSEHARDLNKVLQYFLTRVHLDLEILDANELIPRTSEQARLLGVDFFSVFSRGSQFKVESLMFRIAKPESFVLVSPSRKQVGQQNALECLPLVMEPQSAFYPSPLLVLDFQSLYPSVMIAYNYCYSTCLGRIVQWRGTNKMGFADFKRAPRLLELVKDHLNIAPNGMMYVKPEMRKSLLAKMLGEILETRVMVKSGMKVDKDDRTLQQLLNNRQLALKLIANVTYGYTSASFSGRMPCSEIADSIVQTGRETLEKTIAFIHSVPEWGAEVVYGDTDSLFVYLKGKTRDQAFDIGEDIASRVTAMNPRPVKLKFEKVYHPCVLLAKKRYVGHKYESRTQKTPEFDAKGIETVRRDGTPAEQKTEEKALKMLFHTADLSQIKAYFQAQCAKIMSGKVSIQDFCFAKEVKLGTYAERGPPPPGALIATKRMLRDPRSEPQYGERVPYVVIAGAPGARLFERCVEPERLLYDAHAELDSEYYISKNIIPPLERIFNLVGANVRAWYDEMPKVMRVRNVAAGGNSNGKARDTAADRKRTMESYMATSFCLVCRTKLAPPAQGDSLVSVLPLCDKCRLHDGGRSLVALRYRLLAAGKKKADIDSVCRSCAAVPFGDEVQCDSRDCPVFYSRVKADAKLAVETRLLGPVIDELEGTIAQSREGAPEW